MTVRDLQEMCRKAVDEHWSKLTPEQKRKIRENVLRKSREFAAKGGRR